MHDLSTPQADVFSLATVNKAEDDDNVPIHLGTVTMEQFNQITQENSENQQNYKMLYLQAMEEIKQLREQVKTELKEEVGVQVACLLCCVRIIVIIQKY